MNEKIYLELWCGVGQWESVLGMQKQSRNLQKMREGSLSVRNEVLFLNEFRKLRRPATEIRAGCMESSAFGGKTGGAAGAAAGNTLTGRSGNDYQGDSGSTSGTDLLQVVCHGFRNGRSRRMHCLQMRIWKTCIRNSLYGREREMMEYAGTGSESSSVQTVHQQIRFGYESGMRLYRCTLPGGDSPGGAWGACLFEYGLSVSDF